MDSVQMVKRARPNHVDYKKVYPGLDRYNIPVTESHDSPCMSSLWRHIPIRVSWVKALEFLERGRSGEGSEHDEKPDYCEDG